MCRASFHRNHFGIIAVLWALRILAPFLLFFYFCLLGASEPSLTLFVTARHLDYSGFKELLQTMAKHPSDGSKNGDVGHAWIRLEGEIEGRRICLEGGHSAETGRCQPKYLEGIAERIEKGEPNPIEYLWSAQKDGFFQRGSGGHTPTYAVRRRLTKEQFLSILSYIRPEHYDYRNYSLVTSQCASFVANVAEIAGLDLDISVTISIPRYVRYAGKQVELWNDPVYASLTVASPDVLEKSLKRAVKERLVERIWIQKSLSKWR